MTNPTNKPSGDDELRGKISKMCEGIAAGYHGEDGIDHIMQLIQADRKKHELQARIDELKTLPVNWESGYDNNLRKHYSKVYDDLYDKRLIELKHELEKL